VKIHLRVKDPGSFDHEATEASSSAASGWILPDPLSLPYVGLINKVYRWVLLPAVAFVGISAHSAWHDSKVVAYVSVYQAIVLSLLWLTLRLRADLTLPALRITLYSIYAGFVFELLARYVALLPEDGSVSIDGYLGLALFSLTIFIVGAHTVHSPAGARLASFSMWLLATIVACGGVSVVAYHGQPVADLALMTVRFTLGGLVAFGMTMIFSHLYGLHVRMQAERSLLKRYALTDSLTGLPNRLAFETTLERDYTLSLRTRQPLSLIMLDLDRFKRVNDTYGHNRGDAVLAQLAQVLQSVIRGSDHPARWGGEEFVIVLPNSTTLEAAVLAERIRKAVEKEDFQVGALTVSLGVAQLEGIDSPLSLARRADEALYRAKAAGRNRVECDDAHAMARIAEITQAESGDCYSGDRPVASGE
jgi:diguanylate cyclase (GGDEF)-like protein